MTNDVVICSPLRTPVGKYGGVFRRLGATELASQLLQAVIARTGLPPSAVDDVLLGQCYPNGESPAIGRVAALDAGFPVTVPGLQIDRRCGSGLQAVINATMQVATGACDIVIAGGAESMSRVEHYTDEIRFGVRGNGPQLHDRLARARVTAGGRDHPLPGGMLETAENLRRDYTLSRADQDDWAIRSHQRACAAIEGGRFAAEIVPVSVPGRKDTTEVVDTDEHPRANLSVEQLAQLTPVLAHRDPDATVTAGNASGQNDGAAACIVASREKAAEYGLQPVARLLAWAVAGVPPETMGIGPIPSTQRALTRAGLAMADMDLIELNEAFASQTLACLREWNLNDHQRERVNVNGSGISLGHPVGATGARILATLVHELHRRDARYGLETMCIGGGQGLTAIIERIG